MKKLLSITSLAIALGFLVVVPSAHAIGGCDDSPENPTLVLAGLAGAAYTASQLRQRVRGRRAAKNQIGR